MAARNRTQNTPSVLHLAVAYARCSSSQQERSVEQQIEALNGFIKTKGWKLATESFVDEAISGSELSRPGLDRLLDYLQKSPASGTVVLWDRSRLSRPDDALDGLLLERRIRDTGWALHFLHGYNKTGNELSDAVVPHLETALNGAYLRDLSTKTVRGLVDHVRSGGVPGGKTAYGYRKRLTYTDGTIRVLERRAKHRKEKGQHAELIEGDPTEVAIVRRVFKAYADGSKGMARICAELNAEEIAPPSGKPEKRWCVGTLRAILLNRVYVGDVVWNRFTSSKFSRIAGKQAVKQEPPHQSQSPGKLRDTTTYAANPENEWLPYLNRHPPLVSRDLFEKAGEVMRQRAKQSPRRRALKGCYPLTGLLYCAHCGSTLNGNRSGKSKRYACSSWRRDNSCRPFSQAAEPLEAAVLRGLREAFVPDRSDRSKLRAKLLFVLSGRPQQGERVEVQVSVRRSPSWRAERDCVDPSALSGGLHVAASPRPDHARGDEIPPGTHAALEGSEPRRARSQARSQAIDARLVAFGAPAP